MKAKTKSKKAAAPQFSNRVRFNWGYHDVAAAVRNGYSNFGFPNHGPLAGLNVPADVMDRHFDKTYAAGWVAGFVAASCGIDTSSSESAWIASTLAN